VMNFKSRLPQTSVHDDPYFFCNKLNEEIAEPNNVQ